MKVTFYGVRGSIPTPGAETARYGGNTPCVVLESNSGQKLILDAGTGLRLASAEFDDYAEPIHLLLSHHHWDHLQGFPFFTPIFESGRQVIVYPGDTQPAHDTAVIDQMTKSYFPVKSHQLASNITIKKVKFGQQGGEIGDFSIQAQTMNHPDGGNAYRISCDDKVLVYATDNELSAPEQHNYHSIEQWARFCYGADLLIHDAQYVDGEMGNKQGWGHSSVSQTLALAEVAQVKLLALFSHDPLRTDECLDNLTAALLAQKPKVSFFFAKEGRRLNL